MGHSDRVSRALERVGKALGRLDKADAWLGHECINGGREMVREASDLLNAARIILMAPDHPLRDGRPRCPHCMASGLDGAREELEGKSGGQE